MPRPTESAAVRLRHALPEHREDRTRLLDQLCGFLAEDPHLRHRLIHCADEMDRSATKIEGCHNAEPWRSDEAEWLRRSADTVRRLSDILAELGTVERIIVGIEKKAPHA